MNEGHISVLLKEAVEYMDLKPGQTAVDGTLGGGGHASAIIEKIMPNGLLIGIDKDIDAIERCKIRLLRWHNNIEFVYDDFKDIDNIMNRLNIKEIDAALLDLGVSSYQLDQAERGFSYNKNARLDMRMDLSSAITAEYIVNRYSQEELARLIKEYGEERWAARIAEFIVKERLSKPITTTDELVRVIKNAVPKGARQEKHPAKKTFQALRIEVNKELEGLESALIKYIRFLAPNGRLCVITFHSLEDRIVKNTFKKMQDPCECPQSFPVCICGKVSLGRVVNKKPICPSEKEVAENQRARSAKLRVFAKVNNH